MYNIYISIIRHIAVYIYTYKHECPYKSLLMSFSTLTARILAKKRGSTPCPSKSRTIRARMPSYLASSLCSCCSSARPSANLLVRRSTRCRSSSCTCRKMPSRCATAASYLARCSLCSLCAMTASYSRARSTSYISLALS